MNDNRLKIWASLDNVKWDDLTALEREPCKEHYEAHMRWGAGGQLIFQYTGKSWRSIVKEKAL